MSCCDGGKKQASQPEPNLNWNNNQRQQQVKNSFKVVFLGKSGVGKTSITLRFCRDTFQDGAEATIGYFCLI
jgi:GTPase SAR1 family protein